MIPSTSQSPILTPSLCIWSRIIWTCLIYTLIDPTNDYWHNNLIKLTCPIWQTPLSAILLCPLGTYGLWHMTIITTWKSCKYPPIPHPILHLKPIHSNLCCSFFDTINNWMPAFGKSTNETYWTSSYPLCQLLFQFPCCLTFCLCLVLCICLGLPVLHLLTLEINFFCNGIGSS